ncbi:MAG: OmpA family protein [Spirochaetota bacterium]|nr:MAG: OmpA family protein [Spirochaetota bacterium]
MDRKRLALFAALFITTVLILASCTTEEVSQISLPEGRTAKIIFLLGEVYIKSETSEWVQAQVGDVLEEGTLVRTGVDSYCEIVLSSGSLFRMKDRTELLIALLPSSDREPDSLIKLFKGDLLTKVQKIAYSSSDSIETQSATLGVRGTEFLVHEETSGTEVLVASGAVRVKMDVKEVDTESLPKGMVAVVRKIENGVKVREGYKLEITIEKVDRLNRTIEEIIQRKTVTPSELDSLKQEVILKPQPLSASDRRKLEEFKTLSLRYTEGETFYISPNFDGINDEFVFSTEAFSDEKFWGYKLVVLDSHLNEIKVITGRKPEEANSIRLPETISWNMVSDEGYTVSNGNYVYEFYTEEKNGKYRLQVKGKIVVDTTAPFLQVTVPDTIFSPNNDGVKDTVLCEINAEEDAEWTATISTIEGIVVKTIEWGKDIPDVFEWDGKGENGNVLPEGVYSITITGQDKAGNVTDRTVKEIALDVRERQASVDVDRSTFSPNADGSFDTITFKPILSDRSRIDTWDLIVQTEKGDTARRFRGRRSIPAEIKWDGKPQKGKSYEHLPKELPSGRYFYFLKVIYRSGVNTYSFRKELIIDNDPPEIDVDVVPKLFSPDGDGKDDLLLIKPKIIDQTSIASWRANIYTSSDKHFKTFRGRQMPKEEIQWDGISDTGILVDSGEDYYLVLEATDTVNNTAKSEKIPFSIDILVITTDRGLKIQVSNIEFGFNTANLKGDKTFTILNKIIYVLRKYDKYSIIVEGHTDSIGSEEYNLNLSKKRAESVGRYLIDNGISADRLSYEGFGPKYPIDTNETEEGRARNRRVEFILIRK